MDAGTCAGMESAVRIEKRQNVESANFEPDLGSDTDVAIPWGREFNSEFSPAKARFLRILPKIRKFCLASREWNRESREFAI